MKSDTSECLSVNLFNCIELQFPHLKNRDNNNHIMGCCRHYTYITSASIIPGSLHMGN